MFSAVLVLPQLRSATAMDLGCSAQGHSRSGRDVRVWYCVILAGRLSQDLNTMREVSFLLFKLFIE